MKYINGNILDIENGIIIHQVNCQNVMGSGLAKQLYTKYPIVKESYHKFCFENSNVPKKLLGNVDIVEIIVDKLYIVNLFGQREFGRIKDIVYTDYNAFYLAMIKLFNTIPKDLPVYIPYKIGCGLANGNWDRIIKILDKIEKDYDVEFNIVKLQN